MDKRLRLTPDEVAIIEGLRHEKALWNAALEAVLVALPDLSEEDRAKIMELRK